jgi:D-amino-acid oxidase
MADVTVIGCGVIGLTAAVRMREAGLDARIVAAGLPLQTTSSVSCSTKRTLRA